MTTLTGTPGNDTLNGGNEDDTINGLGGFDFIDGGAGNDLVNGGDDNDYIGGGAGADAVYGGAGDDKISSGIRPGTIVYPIADDLGVAPIFDTDLEVDYLYGEAGWDSLTAGIGDYVDGGADFDTVYISFQAATSGVTADFRLLYANPTFVVAGATFVSIEGVGWIEGSEFDDFLADAGNVNFAPIFGRGGNDHIVAAGVYTGNIFGGSGNDLIDVRARFGGSNFGGTGDDVVLGGSGVERYFGDDGNDTINAGGANDQLIGGRGSDFLDGGAGDDTAVFSGTFAQYAITYDVDAGNYVITDTQADRDGQDRLVSIESLKFSDGVRALAAPPPAPPSANDTLIGTPGNDRLDGGAGSDTMRGGAGDDTYVVDVPTDIVDETTPGSSGTDNVEVAFFSAGTYTLPTGVENGSITGSANGIVLVGNDGPNVLIAATAALSVSSLYGGLGADRLEGRSGAVTMAGGAGDDNYVVYRTDQVIVEQSGEGIDHVQIGMLGISTYVLGDNVENATISNGTGAVSVTGNASNNVLVGSSYNNTMLGMAGNDTFDGQLGEDVIDGGADNDTLILHDTFSSYTITLPNATDIVLTRGYEKLTVRNVENFQFTDGTRSLAALAALVGGPLDDVLLGTAGNDYIDGQNGNDTISGLGGNDTLRGGTGNDFLDGGSGADNLFGGAGDDTYVIESLSDVVNETESGSGGNDTVLVALNTAGTYLVPTAVETTIITTALNGVNLRGMGHLVGGAGNNILEGTVWGEVMEGGAGNDTLIGGTATFDIYSDLMRGGTGDDIYEVSVGVDIVEELENEGTDLVNLVFSSGSAYTLGANVENATMANEGRTLTGNALANILTDGSGANTINGGAGNDTLVSGGGEDTLDGGADHDTAVLMGAFGEYTVSRPNASDVIFTRDYRVVTTRNVENFQFSDGMRTFAAVVATAASPFNDDLTGTAANNEIDGLAGDDRINGLGGDDRLVGGVGNDTLIGGSGNDTLIGGVGDDIYEVDSAGDLVYEYFNEGTDLVNVAFTAAGTYTLSANVENAVVTAAAVAPAPAPAPAPSFGGLDPALLALLGLAPAPAPAPAGAASVNLTGNALNNILTGNAGANVLTGKAGDDTYVIQSGADTVVEAANEGTDQVNLAFTAAGSYTLTANVENAAITTATAGVNITGNELANVLLGNAAANSLTGGAGNDTLAGSGGVDTVDGGADSDTVVLAGAFAEYTITRPNATDVVFTRAGETVTVRNVETFQFADGTKTRGEVIGNTASPFNDDLTGTAGNDTLDGLAGADTMSGGQGDDTYVVDNPSDIVIELLNEGADQVNVAFSAAGTYTLSANVENATVTSAAVAPAPAPAPAPGIGGLDPALLALLGVGGGPAPAPAPVAGGQGVNLTGNALNNILTGNAGANVLTGKAGDDTY
ncbi:MAG: calcium-binding protein, partial [Burkholderiales bacterium]